ncbi:phosphohydrolase [Flectobacillus major]|uniref:phosphohydrolase n=1 Tax=Flectobacillus major TaxID=103 RepID=UPI0003FA984B|nr:phosphohydrolase [Flectobacillus major]
MKLVQLIVDGQATDEQIAQFKQNMDKCLPCEKGYELETCIKDAMKLRLEKKCVPTALIDCIKKKISGIV